VGKTSWTASYQVERASTDSPLAWTHLHTCCCSSMDTVLMALGTGTSVARAATYSAFVSSLPTRSETAAKAAVLHVAVKCRTQAGTDWLSA